MDVPSAAASSSEPLAQPTPAEEAAVAAMFHQLLQHLPDEFKWALLAEAVQSVDTSALQHLAKARDEIIAACSRLDGNILRGIAQYVEDAEAAAGDDDAAMAAAADEVAAAMMRGGGDDDNMNVAPASSTRDTAGQKRRRDEEPEVPSADDFSGFDVPPMMTAVEHGDIDEEEEDGDIVDDDRALMDAIRRSHVYDYAYSAAGAKAFYTADASDDAATGPVAWPTDRGGSTTAGAADDDAQSQADEL